MTELMRIVALGARSPQGLNALQIAMAVRAGLLEPRATSFIDRRNQRVGMVHCRFLDERLTGFDRMVALATLALADAAAQLTTEVPLILALSEHKVADVAPERLLSEVARRVPWAVRRADSACLERGAAGLVDALLIAQERLDQGAPAVLVGAVDTFYDADVLSELDASWRLHQPGVEDGFVPSEGAAFLLLTPDRDDAAPEGVFRHPPRPLARVRWLASAQEPLVSLPEDEQDAVQPVLAQAWTQLMIEALAALPAGLRWIWTDVNGEFERVREWSRLDIRFHEELQGAALARLPDLMGDAGAARGALGVAVACEWWAAGCAPADEVLLALRSEGAERAALLLEVAK